MPLRHAVVPAVLVAALLGCSNLPTDLQSTRNAGAPTPGDTSAAGLPASVRVAGRIIGVSAAAPVAGSTDTLRHEPIPHARITVKRNILVNGQSAQELAATLSADAEGRFHLDGLRGGYYIVEASAPGSGYRDGWEYLPATRAAVEVNLYLWRQ